VVKVRNKERRKEGTDETPRHIREKIYACVMRVIYSSIAAFMMSPGQTERQNTLIKLGMK